MENNTNIEKAQKIFYTVNTEGWKYIEQWVNDRIQQYQNNLLCISTENVDKLVIDFVKLSSKLQALKEFLRYINEMLNLLQTAKKGEVK